MVSDSIGDLIIQLKNAGNAGKVQIAVPYSEFKFEVAEKLRKKGYAKSVSRRGKKVKKYLDIELQYINKKPKISGKGRNCAKNENHYPLSVTSGYAWSGSKC